MKRNLAENVYASDRKRIGIDDLPKHDYINYLSIPSLESIAIMNVATHLCKKYIKERMLQHSLILYEIGDRNFRRYEAEIIENNLSLLPLPSPLKAKVSNVIKPIVLEILKGWRYTYGDIDSICLNSEGTVDKIETLKQLIDKDSVKHLDSIYRLACKCCFEVGVRHLWDKLPTATKNEYLINKDMYKASDNHLVAYWTCSINNELPRFISGIKINNCRRIRYNRNRSLHLYMFRLALSESNSLAVKYFWNKLTPVEINNNLSKWVRVVIRNRSHYEYLFENISTDADVLCFLLSKMSEGQQKEVLQKNIRVILDSLHSDWPWQRYLLPTIQVMWEFIDEEFYVKFVLKLSRNGIEKKSSGMLRELWHISPMNLRKSVIQYILHTDDGYGIFVIKEWLEVGDVGFIEALLNDANSEEKARIMFSLAEKNTKLYNVIYADKLSLIDKLMEALSESDINRFKRSVVLRNGNSVFRQCMCDDNWDMVGKFFSWAFASQDEIDYFKNEIINKKEITLSLLQKGKYQLVNKFLDWCFSEEEIDRFKMHFAASVPEVVELGATDWCSFEKFLDWCFDSEQEISDFKSGLLRSPELRDIIFRNLLYRCHKFEFVDKLLNWCCHSSEELKRYKGMFLLSDEGLTLLKRFVYNHNLYSSYRKNWELLRTTFKLFSPLEEDVMTELKEAITKKIDFNTCNINFISDSSPLYIYEENIFRLIDDNSYDIDRNDDSDSTSSE